MSEVHWPADWAERVAGKGCPLCAGAGGVDNDHSLQLWRGRVADVRLQRHSFVAGYCIVVWNGDHVAEPTDLPAADAAAYWSDVMDASRAIQAAFRPVKINSLTLGNSVPHLHTHVFPRYADDPSPGRPLDWGVLTNVPPTDEATLREQAAALLAAHANK